MESPPTTPVRRQRLSAYALVVREDAVLLTQLSALSTRPGAWTLPGGGIDHGEDPRAALIREVYEETGLRALPGRLLDLHSLHHEGVAPDGVLEDYHAVRIVIEATVADDAPEPRVVEADGTTAAAAWFSVEAVAAGAVDVVDLVAVALAARDRAATVSEQRVDRQPWQDRLRIDVDGYGAACAGGDAAAVAAALRRLRDAVAEAALCHGVSLDTPEPSKATHPLPGDR